MNHFLALKSITLLQHQFTGAYTIAKKNEAMPFHRVAESSRKNWWTGLMTTSAEIKKGAEGGAWGIRTVLEVSPQVTSCPGASSQSELTQYIQD